MAKFSPTNSPEKNFVGQPLAERPVLTAEEYAQAARAESTVRSYANDIRYIARAGCPLPATPADVVEWLSKAAGYLKPATIQRRIVSLGVWHRENGYPSPTRDQKVKKVFAGICRTLGTNQRAVKPLVRDDLISVLVAVDYQNPIAAARDSALLLLAFASALRRSNLVAIKVEHLTAHDYGLDIFLPRSKTDRTGAGRVVSVPKAIGDKCPIEALAHWLAVSGITAGYVFRSVNKHGHIGTGRLDVGSVGRIFKRAILLSGRDPSEYSSHSGRAGFITSAATVNMPAFQIAQVTGHKGIQSLQKYMRVIEQRRIASLL